MTWERVLIAGKSADVFMPTSPARFAMLFLHDCDGATLAERESYTSALADEGVACVCPFGGDSWWADRRCPSFDPHRSAERYLLDDVIPLMNQRWSIGLFGIGMGGQGALRLAFKYPQRFPIVASLSAAIDHHEWYGHGLSLDEMYASKEQCRQDTATLHVHPSRFPKHLLMLLEPDSIWERGNDRLHEKLTALGIDHTFDPTPSDETARRVVAFLKSAWLDDQRSLL